MHENDGAEALYWEEVVDDGKLAIVPTSAPVREHYTFLGWFTSPEGGDENRYNFSAPVTGDLVLYAHWRLTPLSYTVRYLEEMEGGERRELYSAKTVTSPLFLPGEEVREKAVPVPGYLADAAEKSISLDYENNEIVFLYTQKLPELQYTVHYVLENHPDIHVAPSVTETVGGNTISMKLPAAAVDKEYMAAQGAGEDILAEEYYPLHNVL